jgi:hypothetical protein
MKMTALKLYLMYLGTCVAVYFIGLWINNPDNNISVLLFGIFVVLARMYTGRIMSRGELEMKIKDKFKELDDKKNKLTMLMCQKEEEYAEEYQKKETQLYEYWNQKNAQLKEQYEEKIKKLSGKNK